MPHLTSFEEVYFASLTLLLCSDVLRLIDDVLLPHWRYFSFGFIAVACYEKSIRVFWSCGCVKEKQKLERTFFYLRKYKWQFTTTAILYAWSSSSSSWIYIKLILFRLYPLRTVTIHQRSVNRFSNADELAPGANCIIKRSKSRGQRPCQETVLPHVVAETGRAKLLARAQWTLERK